MSVSVSAVASVSTVTVAAVAASVAVAAVVDGPRVVVDRMVDMVHGVATAIAVAAATAVALGGVSHRQEQHQSAQEHDLGRER